MPGHYYNEIDPFCCEWLQNLMDAGKITAGKIDRRSIADVNPNDLLGYEQCHFFAGIGGWPLALRLAGWIGPCWTGSCPCQPFSSAGKGLGENDPRHLWPEFRRIIEECRPPVVFGEQVESKDGRRWLSGVRVDLEALGYAVGAADLCAAGEVAPHRRQRLYWVADARRERSDSRSGLGRGMEKAESSKPSIYHQSGSGNGGLANRDSERLSIGQESNGSQNQQPESASRRSNAGGCGGSVRMGDSSQQGQSLSEHQELPGAEQHEEGRATQQPGSAWANFSIVHCRDSKTRRISAQSGDEPLAYGIPRILGPALAGVRGLAKDARRNRVGRLRGYGNAIVPQLAAEFVRAFMEIK
jgi:DNA (cytosine-5)-methyltransferase 1